MLKKDLHRCSDVGGKLKFNILEVKGRETLNTDLIEKIEMCLSRCLSEDKKRSNYTRESLNIKGHEYFHCLVDDDFKLISFSGVFRYPNYPDQVYRVLNRSFLFPDYRKPKFEAVNTTYILPLHLELLSHDKPNYVFISREGRYGHLTLSHLKRNFRLKDWFLTDDFHKVTATGNNQKCYQRILVKEFRVGAFLNSPLPGLGLKEWLALEKG